MALPDNRKRARSDDEKEARKQAILTATRSMVDSSGFDGVTMNAIAKAAGVSKGTLYLYAQSKEELFLTLFVDAMEEVVSKIETEATPDTLADVLTRSPAEVSLFLPLLARLFTVIENNVGDAPLFENKRRMRDMGVRVAHVISRLTGAPHDRARAASLSLMLSMQGAAQFDLGTRRDTREVPDDLKAIFEKESFMTSYRIAVDLVLSGALRT